MQLLTLQLKDVAVIKSVFVCLCRNDIREISNHTKKCQWFEDPGPVSSARAQCCHGYSFVGHPLLPPSPQMILGEDYVTLVLKEQAGSLLVVCLRQRILIEALISDFIRLFLKS